MPGQIVAFAAEAEDVETFGERLSAPVEAACDVVVGLVLTELGASQE